jgi:membrane-associated phospholipid phosphatase
MKIIAKFISIIFHPLIITTYVLILLMAFNPYVFGAQQAKARMVLVLLVFFSTFLIPGIAVALMKFIGLVDSFEMEDSKQRILPYIACGIFYLWMFVNIVHNPDIPFIFSAFILGATAALFIAFIINIFSKISLHAIGAGGLVGIVVLILASRFASGMLVDVPLLGTYELNVLAVLMIVLILAGLIGSARLILKAHEPKDIFGGFFLGFCTQFLAFIILFQWLN